MAGRARCGTLERPSWRLGPDFHADFALLLGGGKEIAECHLCFGCMEAKIFVDGHAFRARLEP